MKVKASGAVPTSKTTKRPKASPKATRAAGADKTALYLTLAGLAVVVFACYANSIGNGFVFDDHRLVLVEGRPRDLSHFFETLLVSYRPVRKLSYALDFMIWGDNPAGFHLTNMLIHSANAMLAYLLARALTGAKAVSLVAALVFAVHPIQTDAVTYISGRRDLLFTMFYLAGFLSYLKYRSGRSLAWFALFLASWGLSLMSKEMGVTLPALIFLWNFCRRWDEHEGAWLAKSVASARKALAQDKWLYAVLAAAALAYTWYMIFERKASGRVSDSGVQYWGGSFYTSALTMLRVHAWYLKQLVFPTPIAQYYGAFDVSTTILDARVIFSLAVVGSVLAWGLALLKRDRVMAFAVLAYFASLLPVSQIIPHHELLADHYLYLPIFCFGLFAARLAGGLAARDSKTRKLVYSAAAIVIAVFAMMTVWRNRDWKDEFSLWQANYESVPNSPRAAYNLGGMYMKRNPRRAEELFKQAIANDPKFEPAYLSLAQLYVASRRPDEAEQVAERGLELPESNEGSYILRNPALLRSQLKTIQAAARWDKGDAEGSERILREAISIYPLNMDAYLTLANVYRGKDSAKEQMVLRQGLAASPDSYEVNARLASALASDKKVGESLPYLRKLLALNPSRADCERSAPHMAAAKSAAAAEPAAGEVRDALRELEQRCQRL